MKINIDDVVMIKRNGKNRGKWKIGIIENIFMGKDNQSKHVTGRALLKDRFNCCIKWS